MDTSRLFHTLNQKVRLLTKELNEVLQPFQLFSSQWTILYILSEKGPMSQTEIWKYLEVEAPTTTRTLVRMEASGWIYRKPGRDKRERIVELTETAKEKYPSIKKTVENLEQRLVYQLSDQEQHQLQQLLEKLEENRKDSDSNDNQQATNMDEKFS
ncbi:DNA-binding MarR family transcriptional regulator [Evansella vedderi]|uniref:DNA-binding MarR family transcriptional regulator n=1 Tax=Evansella vedderi TaxID=38282 RepID=A0ABT9ZNV4_9BACI|nr:MarR family transcriptional regulator [Evansella vedderi]MDQ0252918.1 DNA-binding MarR family transcriptional regulator [Evansella vedderi]